LNKIAYNSITNAKKYVVANAACPDGKPYVLSLPFVSSGNGILNTCFKNAFKHTTDKTQIAILIADLLNPSKDKINNPYMRLSFVVKIVFTQGERKL